MKRDRWSELNDEAEPKARKFAATNYQLERDREVAKAGYMRGYRAGATRNERRGFAAHAEPVTSDNPSCWDCPPVGYPTDKTRCAECPRMETAVDCPKCGYKLQSIAHFEHCGHGHVVKRHDGMLTRCGGPSMCKVCAAEQVAINQP